MTIVVDVANVMGSRPDGWWRDRAGAAVRLHVQLARLAATAPDGTAPDGTAPDGTAPVPAPEEFVMVLEGAAKAAAARLPDDPNVRVVLAPGSGDDAIVAVVRELGGHCSVVTADRGLRARCVAAGAKILGPGWLLSQLRP